MALHLKIVGLNKRLQSLPLERVEFTGTLFKYYYKKCIAGNEIVLRFINVTINGEFFNYINVIANKDLIHANLKEGSVIKSTCRVMPYKRVGRVVRKFRNVELLEEGSGKDLKMAMKVIKIKGVQLARHLRYVV